MSSNHQKILSRTTILNFFELKIDDVLMLKDEIVSIEIKQNFYSFGLTGTLKIKDSFDLNNNGKVKVSNINKIQISLKDINNKISTRTFRIINTTAALHNERFKLLDIMFIDEITYLLSNSYISKGFMTTPVKAFQECLTHLGVDKLLETDKMTYDIKDSSVIQSFVLTSDKSVLDFFQELFRRENIRVYQDRFTLVVKEVKLSELEPLDAPESGKVTYTNETANNTFLFKIHDYIENTNFTYNNLRTLPKQKLYRYNFVKEIVNDTKNLSDISDLKLNNSDFDLQNNYGIKTNTQGFYENGSQTFDIFNEYMSNNSIEMSVPGSLEHSNIGILVNVKLKGNPLYATSNYSGDMYSSGVYFVQGVTDKIIGDKFISRLDIQRTDSQKPLGV